MEPNLNAESQEKQWITQDGRKLYLHELTTCLRNALAYAKLHGPYPHICDHFSTYDEGMGVWVTLSWRLSWVKAFEAELEKREKKE
jgi:hypothetical protein